MSITDLTRQLKTLGDETRLRILHVLGHEELSVTELGQTLNLGQSRVSGQLAVLRELGLLRERKEGRRTLVRLDETADDAVALLDVVRPRIGDSRAGRLDLERLEAVVAARASDGSTTETTSGLGTGYLPGRNWESFARALLGLVEARRVVDIGVGSADMTVLFAGVADEVIAIDPSEAALGRARKKVERSALTNVDFRGGAIEDLPVDDATADLVIASQVLHHAEHPREAVAECARVLAPNGRLVILDLVAHDEDWVRDEFEHRHLGFREADMRRWFTAAKLDATTIGAAGRDRRPPHFVTLLATATKTSASVRRRKTSVKKTSSRSAQSKRSKHTKNQASSRKPKS